MVRNRAEGAFSPRRRRRRGRCCRPARSPIPSPRGRLPAGVAGRRDLRTHDSCRFRAGAGRRRRPAAGHARTPLSRPPTRARTARGP
ncbi:hypothetical protein GE300_17475 [Rhodobacteraceae bacterium 2CG4]|uniref:Uncharacterized protein n=1 Tax=Halovulum marinum TaxID=2662447 RepID=A0A6L5Z5Q0_9RHOB|nr:hypothetical protein [Halovulum marinum]